MYEAQWDPNDYEIWTVRAPGSWILVMRGDLDISSSTEMSGVLAEAIGASVPRILIDLEETAFLDAACLGVLVRATQDAARAGLDLRLVAPSDPVTRLLRLTQLQDFFAVDADLIEAYPSVA